MNISPVSFGNTTASQFRDKVNQPQAYTKPEEPTAATTIKDSGKKKHPVRKAIAGVVITAAAAAGALAAGQHFGLFEKLVEKGGKFATAGNYLNTASDAVINAFNTVKDKIVALIPKK